MSPDAPCHDKRRDGEAADRSQDSIVISGMAGLYPGAHNVNEMADMLYSKTNPVSMEDCRYQFEHPESPRHAGSIPELDRFDAQFFKVHHRLSNSLDPMARKMLEQTYHAIVDAGVCPESLSGKKVGVFVGTSVYDMQNFTLNSSSFLIIGWNKTMFANRISYWLKVQGPSYNIDAGCCSSLSALQMAHQAMASGDCEAAVVAASKIWLHPQVAVSYGRLSTISKDGKTRSFDQNASGPAFSEAVNVLFLQKAKDALRVYAELVHVKCDFDTHQRGDEDNWFGFYRQPEILSKFLRSFYKEANVPPQAVDYVEAFGCAVPEVDKAELEAIDAVYCEGRRCALPVGSVTSNIGHTESASGIAAITKVLLGYHTGVLAGNLHLDTVRNDIACLREGRINLLQEDYPFREGYTAVNGLSITGLNGHALLHNHYKPKDIQKYKTDIPYLVPISGRHESAVKKILDDLKSHPIDPEQLGLLHNIHMRNTSSHMGRGFTILATNNEKQTVCLGEKIDYFDGVHRPLWFVYSGMGSQWAGMGAHLMRVPSFAAAIDKCRRVLEPKGIDIIHIITTKDKSIFDNVLYCFLGIAAVQIGLTDFLTELGLIPDKMIGHSTGEMGCAYADGCLTAEEMILTSYYRGIVSLEIPSIRGAMAAVGAGYQQIINLCPPDIEVACHNSAESCTISGPADSISAFTKELASGGIFVKVVASSNIAYHSKYIADAGPQLNKYLKEVIKAPKARSERWISTSVPRHAWNEPEGKYGGAEYYTNNLLNPVLFEEASQLIPANAVLIEIAPHGLLQAILKRSMSESCVNIPLTRRGVNDLKFLLEAVGKIYMQGFVPQVSTLYPTIDFPVSTGTPMLSHLVEWAHDEIWTYPKYEAGDNRLASACKFIITIHDDDLKYLQGHVLKEKNVYPLSAVLMDVWDTLAMSRQLTKRAFSVRFRDVRVYALPVLHERRQLRLSVTVQKVSGEFEVLDDVTKVATGVIVHDLFSDELSALNLSYDAMKDFNVNSEAVYEMAFNRDCRYSGDFRSIHSATSCLSEARVVWQNNWVTFIDAMFQLDALRQPHETVHQLEFIKNLYIDIRAHRNSQMVNLDEKDVMIAHVYDDDNRIGCGGITVENIHYRDIPFLTRDPVLIEPLHLATRFDTTQSEAAVMKDVRSTHGSTLLLKRDSSSASVGVDVTIEYVYAGVNDVDGAMNTGALTMGGNVFDNMPQVDFSGLLNNGVRVMGVAKPEGSGSLRVLPELVWPVPEHWSLEDAATVPRAFCLAYYCLAEKYQLFSGMKIYVENGMSAFGQAAISLAVATDCEVFSTVGNAREKRQLLTLFPEVKDDHICVFDQFSDMILTKTERKGCEFVISSPRGDLMMDTLGCAKEYGVTIVTSRGKDVTFGMGHMSNERNIVFLNFSSVFQNQNLDFLRRLHRYVGEGIAKGAVRPLTRIPLHLVEAAGTTLPAALPGTILLDLRQNWSTEQSLSCSSENSHMIVCSNEAFGLLVAEKLVRAGARKLHLHCPSINHYTAETLKLRLKQDVRVQYSYGDLTKQDHVQKFVMECGLDGPVEGIHVILLEDSSKQSVDEKRLMIHNLDLTSRKLCDHLKYFTILNEDGVGQSTCVSRRQHKLPATMLKLESLAKMDSEEESCRRVITRLEAVSALSEAVMLKEPVLLARKQVTSPRSLLEEIEYVMKISISEETDANTTLQDLGVSAVVAQKVVKHIRDAHNLTLSDRDLPTFTINKIREIEDVIYNSEFEETKGLHTFFSHVEPDELLATTDMVFPTTLINRAMGKDQIAVKDPHLVIVGGVDGSHARFVRLCERLQLRALVLQPGLARPEENTMALATRFVQILLTKMKLKGHFYLLGYETGVAVALEMATMLESQGLTGTVFCIGGGPQAVSAAVDEVAASYGSPEALQEAVVRHMAELMAEDDIDTKLLDAAFTEGASWDAKLAASVRLSMGRMSHSAQYVRQVIEAAYTRLQRARTCPVMPRALRSLIVALLPADCHPLALAELQNFSQQPVQAYQLLAPLGRAADDLRCAAIVNRHLSEDIRRQFQLMNRCDKYCTIDV